MTPSPAGILRATKARIATPELWTQGAMGRSARGNPCQYYETRAVSFCLLGAFKLEAGQPFSAGAMQALEALRAETGGRLGMVDWNDNPERTHGDALAALDRAIEAVS